MVALQVLKSRKYDTSPFSQQKTFAGVNGLLRGEQKADETALKRSEAPHYAMRLPTLKLFKHLHGLPANNILCTPEDDKLLEYSAVQQFFLAALALPLLFTVLARETAQPSQLE